VGATVGVGDLERGVGQELGVPAGGVEEVVVAGADEHEVVEGCRAAMGDPADMVGSVQSGGRSQPGKRQCRSRITRA
jgi:hypothetical protein